MKHFSDELWADFVRNLAPSTTARAMQKHIEDGCSKCEATLKNWQNVFRIAQAEGGFSPPETVSDTTTNQHGEFQLEFDAGANMCLSIGHEQDRMVVLPIYNVHSGLGILED